MKFIINPKTYLAVLVIGLVFSAGFFYHDYYLFNDYPSPWTIFVDSGTILAGYGTITAALIAYRALGSWVKPLEYQNELELSQAITRCQQAYDSFAYHNGNSLTSIIQDLDAVLANKSTEMRDDRIRGLIERFNNYLEDFPELTDVSLKLREQVVKSVKPFQSIESLPKELFEYQNSLANYILKCRYFNGLVNSCHSGRNGVNIPKGVSLDDLASDSLCYQRVVNSYKALIDVYRR